MLNGIYVYCQLNGKSYMCVAKCKEYLSACCHINGTFVSILLSEWHNSSAHYYLTVTCLYTAKRMGYLSYTVKLTGYSSVQIVSELHNMQLL